MTGMAIYDALCRKDINAHTFDTGKQTVLALVEEGFDRAFIALHGRGGEDGTIQGALDILGIPYTGSGVLGSALSMDKVRSKQIWSACGLQTPGFIEIEKEHDLNDVDSTLGYPVMIKPVNEGSSVGATKVKKKDELVPAWTKACETDSRVLAERWITGMEYTATILEECVLPLIRLETPREFYDYDAKYTDNSTSYICPCGLNADREQFFSELALDAFDALGASGWGRVDFIVDEDDTAWLIELNTVPGMTDHSLVPMSAKEAGMRFDDLVIRILHTSTASDISSKRIAV
jgi:D-alanine-D-alanine ligase